MSILFFLILIVIFILIYILFHNLIKKHNYWKIRNVKYLKPDLLFGNYREYILLKKYGPQIASEICQKFPDEPYIGTFYGTDPALLVQDPELIKLIMTDAENFSGRENTEYSTNEIITRNNIFFNGGNSWKVMRQALSPLFTTSKLKNMFPLIKESVKEFQEFLNTEIQSNDEIEVKSLLARYTLGCIVSCAFGLNPNTMKRDTEEANPFIAIGKNIFDTTITTNLKLVCRSMWPSLFYGLGFKLFDDSLPAFFKKLYSESSRLRKNESLRNDFIDLLMELKDNKKYLTSESSDNSDVDKKVVVLPVDEDLLAGMSFAIFAAGFETTSTAATLVLYELAKNKAAQSRVIDEVDSYFERHNGEINYECINELPFMEACVEETLRLYPPIGITNREVMQDCTLPTGLSLEKGDRIHVPIYHIQRDPKYFHEPEEFRPERFLGEERKKINPYTYMPFGIGVRICLGKRFSKMPLHGGLLAILKNHRIELAEKAPKKLSMLAVGLTVQFKERITLKFIPRDSKISINNKNA